MPAVAPASAWIPEDDLLLKNAVEAGASLEALAKGAVQFSRRFTIQELQNRWHSLLYDPDISAQASIRMGELEGSSSNLLSKSNKLDKPKEIAIHGKRKFGSIRKQYYAMRKRLRSEFFSSADLGFLAEHNPHNCSGNGGDFHEHVTLNVEPPVGNCMIGDCMSTHFGLQQTDLEILRRAFPHAINDISATNPVGNVGDAFHSSGQDSLAHNQMNTIAQKDCLRGFPENDSSLSVPDALRADGTESVQQTTAHNDNAHCLQDNLVNSGKCTAEEKLDPSQPQSGRQHFQTEDSERKQVTFNSPNNDVQNVCNEFGERQHFSSPNSDGSGTFHMMGFSPPLSSMPLWKTMEDISAPAMPVNMSPEPKEKRQAAEDTSKPLDNDDNKRKGSPGPVVMHSGTMLTDKQNGGSFINSTAMSDGEFADLPDSLLDFSNEDEVLTDVDGKESMDKSCFDNRLVLSFPKHVDEGNLPNVESKTMIASDTGCATMGGTPAASHSHSVPSDQQNIPHSSSNMPSASVLNSKTLQRNDGFTFCTLNTEDTEIPCNDDIFLLIHPVSSFATTSVTPMNINHMGPASSANEKDTRQRPNLMKKGGDPAQSFMASLTAGPFMVSETGQDHGCAVKTEVPDSSCTALAPRHKSIGDPTQCRSAHSTLNSAIDVKLGKDVRKIELGIVDTPCAFRELPLHAEAAVGEVPLPESASVLSVSDKDEPDSDNDIPYFSDIEAMILDMDLSSHEQDLYFRKRVSKYQHEDSKRSIMRLEQCARSSLQRAMLSRGALAILYGRRLKHFIQKTEVILGRPTEEIDVDIDLGKEGRANKISRRQAIIKMEKDGSFRVKNLGKSSISVNGKALGTGHLMTLSPGSLIEIRGMNFVFEINHKSVKQYLNNITKELHGQGNHFKWSSEGEP